MRATLNATARFTINKDLQEARQAKSEGRAISVTMFQPRRDEFITALSAYLNSTPCYIIRKQLWIVSGLRIHGKRTKFSEGVINQATSRAEVKGDGSAAQVPINAGLDIGHQDSDPFIYCYRLHQISLKYSLLWRDWQVSVKPFRRGHI